jgi:micrococcal nuclease
MNVTKDPSPNRFHYSATFRRAIDGDTVVVDIDLGMSIWRKGEALRLKGINTPEVVGANKAAGIAARDYLTLVLGDAKEIVIETFKDAGDKYGRLLARIYVKDADGTWSCVNDEMLDVGHANPWNGTGAKP